MATTKKKALSAPPLEFKNMICPQGEDYVIVSLVSGHQCIVYNKPTKVEKKFWLPAQKLLCYYEGDTPTRSEDEDFDEDYSPLDEVVEAIESMISAEGIDSCLTAGGVPDLKKLKKYAGTNVSREAADDAWDRVKAVYAAAQ